MRRRAARHLVAALALALLTPAACSSNGTGADGGLDSGAAGAGGGSGGMSGGGAGGAGGTAGGDGGIMCGPTRCAPGQICMPSDCPGPGLQCFAVVDGGCPVGTMQVTTCLGYTPGCQTVGCWEQPPPRCVSP